MMNLAYQALFLSRDASIEQPSSRLGWSLAALVFHTVATTIFDVLTPRHQMLT